MADAQIALVGPGDRHGVHRAAQLGKQHPEAALQHLIPVHQPLFQLLPVPDVDIVVAREHRFRGLQPEIPEGLGKGNALGLVEIQNGIV